MAKTVTIKKAEICSIVLSEENFGENGISSNVNYRLMDENNKLVSSPISHKFTTDSKQVSSKKLSADSSKLVSDFWNAIQTAINGKEGL